MNEEVIARYLDQHDEENLPPICWLIHADDHGKYPFVFAWDGAPRMVKEQWMYRWAR